MNTSLKWVLALSLLGGSPLRSQLPAAIEPGARIRVRTTGMPVSEMTGTVTSRDSASLVLHTLDQAASNRAGSARYADVPIDLAHIAALDISHGRHSNAGRGAVIGGSILGGLGLLLGVAAMAEGCNPNEFCIQYTAGDVATVTAVTGAVGAATGALIGALSHHDDWERILPAQASIAPIVRPSDAGGVSVGLSLRF